MQLLSWLRARRALALSPLLWLLSACGGGSTAVGSGAGPGQPVSTPVDAPVRVSLDTPVAPGCTGGSESGSFYVHAEVEPWAAVHPGNPAVMVAAWQQDRSTNGGARAVVVASSTDGGQNWQRRLLPFSRCGGARPGSAGDFERASDPWVDVGPTGILHANALSFNLASGTSASGIVVSRSLDNGQTWSEPISLKRNGPGAFNDKNSLTADPHDARFVYAVWTLLGDDLNGPTWFARSTDGGASWEPARSIYSPVPAGAMGQTTGNRIVVLPNGNLVNFFSVTGAIASDPPSWLGVLISRDKGVTWSAPVRIAAKVTVGTRDPHTGKRVRDGADYGAIAVAPKGDLWVTWQDARFTLATLDNIVVSRSRDGGQTWSTPTVVNRAPTVAAFTPGIAVDPGGRVAVTYHDLRSNTSDPATLPASVWMATSCDGVNWSESAVAGPLEMSMAPDANGWFLGDYQGLFATGTGQWTAIQTVTTTDPGNRTDVQAIRIRPSGSATACSDPVAIP